MNLYDTSDNGTGTITGGTGTGNSNFSGDNGGGVLVYGTFNMNSGTISGNSADGKGGGVYMGGGATSFTVSGTETITGNIVSGMANNVCLWNNNSGQNTLITISNNFDTDSSIVITLYDVSKAFTSSETAVDIINGFTSDLSAYTVTQGTGSDTELYLTLDASGLFDSGTGSADDPYQIATLEQLSYLELYGSNDAINAYGVYYQLTADITLDATYTPIGTTKGFAAQFDGNNHTIGGDIVSSDHSAGIFASIGSGGTVKNLYSTVNVTNSSSSAGGIAGYNSDTIENCLSLAQSVTGGTTTAGRVVGDVGTFAVLSDNYAWSGVLVNGSTVTSGDATSNDGADLYFTTTTGLATTGTNGNTGESILGFTQESYSITVDTIETVAGTYALILEGEATYDGDEKPSAGVYDWTVYFTPKDAIFPTFPVDSGTVTITAKSTSSNTGTLVTDTSTDDGEDDVTTEETEETTTDVDNEDTTTSETTTPTVAGMDDVFEDDYYAEAVEWAVENEVTTGTSDGGFSPDSPASRGQVVTFLYRAFGEPETDGENTFGDVDDDSYYGNAVKWALELGITSGMAEDIFGTEETCTRAQIVTFLYRFFN